MSISLSKQQLLELVQGNSPRAAEKLGVNGVTTNPAHVRGGELFISLSTSSQDGQRQAMEAFDRGAAICLTADPVLSQDFAEPHRVILVPNVHEAFRRIASWWRQELTLPIIGVAGTIGKTTVKEMLSCILLRTGRGIFTEGTVNDEIGILETICRISRDHLWAVFEIGCATPGQTSQLSSLIRPDFGIITSAAPRFLDRFKHVEGLVDESLGILHGMSPTAPLIVARGDDSLHKIFRERYSGGVRPLFDYGNDADCHLRFSEVQSRGFDGVELTLTSGGDVRSVLVKAYGSCHAPNIAGAALVARTLFPAMPFDEVTAGLASYRAPLARLHLSGAGPGSSGERTVFVDSSEASPLSMIGLVKFGGELQKLGRRVSFLLGPMPELGSSAARYHAELTKSIVAQQPDSVVAAGELGSYLGDELSKAGITHYEVATAEETLDVLGELEFDVLLVKGQGGFDLEAVANKFSERFEESDTGFHPEHAFHPAPDGSDESDIFEEPGDDDQ